jgi:hypothetical protein
MKLEEIKNGEFVKIEDSKDEMIITGVEFSALSGKLLIIVSDGKGNEFRRNPAKVTMA